jgi:hypothetical protein
MNSVWNRNLYDQLLRVKKFSHSLHLPIYFNTPFSSTIFYIFFQSFQLFLEFFYENAIILSHKKDGNYTRYKQGWFRLVGKVWLGIAHVFRYTSLLSMNALGNTVPKPFANRTVYTVNCIMSHQGNCKRYIPS